MSRKSRGPSKTQRFRKHRMVWWNLLPRLRKVNIIAIFLVLNFASLICRNPLFGCYKRGHIRIQIIHIYICIFKHIYIYIYTHTYVYIYIYIYIIYSYIIICVMSDMIGCSWKYGFHYIPLYSFHKGTPTPCTRNLLADKLLNEADAFVKVQVLGLRSDERPTSTYGKNQNKYTTQLYISNCLS